MTENGLDASAAVTRFRRVVQVPTVSRIHDEGVDWSAFERIRDLLAELYPNVHRRLELTRILDHALLFRWPGRSADEPVVLMAHLDVVDAEPEGWTSPPFDAEVVDVDGSPSIIGRGCIDDKASLVGILEAVEHLLLTGFTPRHDLYLAFTHNEEVLGTGTPAIVSHLQEQGIRLAFVLDEGGIVGESIFGPVTRDIVYVGVGEKGTVTLTLSAVARGGHASVPPADTCTGRLARAITRLCDARPWSALNEVTRRLIATVGPHAEGAFHRAAALLPADEDAAGAEFASISRDAWAMVHSAPVVTLLSAGHSANAIPERATATVNMRVVPGHRAEELVDWIRRLVDDDGIELELIESRDPSAVSPAGGPPWERLVHTIRETYGDVLVVPYINNGGTDSRNYTGISDHVYRFNPVKLTLAERHTLHAIDERLRLSSFIDGVRFYRSLIGDL